MSKIVRPKTPFEFCTYPVLKEALEKTNYNQTELAQSLGVSQFTVSAWARDVGPAFGFGAGVGFTAGPVPAASN